MQCCNDILLLDAPAWAGAADPVKVDPGIIGQAPGKRCRNGPAILTFIDDRQYIRRFWRRCILRCGRCGRRGDRFSLGKQAGDALADLDFIGGGRFQYLYRSGMRRINLHDCLVIVYLEQDLALFDRVTILDVPTRNRSGIGFQTDFWI
ncbi:hypothetical protein DK68_2911 [Brucella suis]|nr:hypothetical protein C050_02873 [Brucella suis 92/63]ENR24846.1 hypothetical protein C978_02825 [Brucella suis 94/11]ENR30991.1 hypothetical protein C977_02814 [Brucella suis F4/06-146]ENR33603.1 hypothetical protein C006_02967 [Brucella suis F5/03-2]ENR37344.1 hypothetical protein C063_02969 [Brucella suis F8/06-2]ENT32291.1 hypothetical protein C039_02980 [Brucella suis 63/261]ENT38618.1 hypothetical protein C049_03000 [Brucella suis F12/02]ENT40242.1 hypothetical protein B986_02986 [Br